MTDFICKRLDTKIGTVAVQVQPDMEVRVLANHWATPGCAAPSINRVQYEFDVILKPAGTAYVLDADWDRSSLRRFMDAYTDIPFEQQNKAYSKIASTVGAAVQEWRIKHPAEFAQHCYEVQMNRLRSAKSIKEREIARLREQMEQLERELDELDAIEWKAVEEYDITMRELNAPATT